MKPSILLRLAIALLSGQCIPATAQSPITAISAGYQSQTSSVNLYTALPVSLGAFSGCAGTVFTYTFSNGTANQYKLNSFNANGSSYLVAPAAASVVKLRRVNNTQVSGTRNIVYMETTASSANACPLVPTLNFKTPYKEVMEDLLAGGMLNQGTDNVFTNASNGDGNNNNIERVDVIFPGGLNTTTPSQAGFAIFDRGVNYQHDGFKIAAITNVDAAGNPTSFGAVRTCIAGNGTNNGSWGHPSTANGNKMLPSYVLRKDPVDPFLRVSSNINQEIGGVFYTFADLGIKSGQPLYGYALLGPDGLPSPSSAQLLNLNDASVYPTNTTESSGGGLDLVAVNTVFATGSYIVLSLPDKPALQPLPPAPVSASWQVYPTTPARGQSLIIKGLHKGSYALSFYNTSGVSKRLPVNITSNDAISIPSPEMPGIYWIQIVRADGIPVNGNAGIIIQ